MAAVKQALVTMARYPAGGNVKTRLAETLGSEATAVLYAAFLRDLFRWAANDREFDLLVSLADERNREVFAETFGLPAGSIFGQVGDGFSARLYHAIQTALGRGFSRAAVAASDAPELSRMDVVTAFNALDHHDLSVIPAPDGGYTFLGMKEPRDIFTGVKMSTPRVLEDTLELARAGNLTTAVMPPVPDVDDRNSLERLIDRITLDPKLKARLPHTCRILQKEG